MLYLIVYDISNDNRRTKIHKILSGFGEWTQYSLFECFLDAKEMVLLRAQLDQVMKPSEDNVRFYHICQACQSKVKTVGSQPPAEKTIYLI